MRKYILLAFITLAPICSFSQYNWDFGIGIGAANPLGDMGGKELTRRDFVSDLKFKQTQLAGKVFARYKIGRMFTIKAGVDYACLRGADSLTTNPARHYRNLSFRNQTFNMNAMCQFNFYEETDLGNTYRYKDSFKAFIGLGVGALYHNPKAFYQGSWVELRPLMTEGYAYKKFTVAIPAEIGFNFTINKNYRIGWNFTWVTTFTDYLDDVSSNYADPSTFSNPLSIALADRTNHAAANAYGASLTPSEPGWGNNFGYGTSIVEGKPHFNKRGDSSHNDSYLTSTIELSYVLRGKSSLYKSRYSSLFKKGKSKHRKVRAKF